MSNVLFLLGAHPREAPGAEDARGRFALEIVAHGRGHVGPGEPRAHSLLAVTKTNPRAHVDLRSVRIARVLELDAPYVLLERRDDGGVRVAAQGARHLLAVQPALREVPGELAWQRLLDPAIDGAGRLAERRRRTGP